MDVDTERKTEQTVWQPDSTQTCWGSLMCFCRSPSWTKGWGPGKGREVDGIRREGEKGREREGKDIEEKGG